MVKEEIQVQERNETQTWEYIRLPNKKVVGCKKIFNISYRLNGGIDKFKMRFVAKEFTIFFFPFPFEFNTRGWGIKLSTFGMVMSGFGAKGFA